MLDSSDGHLNGVLAACEARRERTSCDILAFIVQKFLQRGPEGGLRSGRVKECARAQRLNLHRVDPLFGLVRQHEGRLSGFQKDGDRARSGMANDGIAIACTGSQIERCSADTQMLAGPTAAGLCMRAMMARRRKDAVE